VKPKSCNWQVHRRCEAQWRRRIDILQAIDNEAGSVKLPIPEGKENEKIRVQSKNEQFIFKMAL